MWPNPNILFGIVTISEMFDFSKRDLDIFLHLLLHRVFILSNSLSNCINISDGSCVNVGVYLQL